MNFSLGRAYQVFSQMSDPALFFSGADISPWARPTKDPSLNSLENNSLLARRSTGRTAIVFACLYAAFMLVSLIVIPVLAPGARIPNPFGPDDASRAFMLGNTRAVQVSDFLQLVSACCLGGLAAALAALQRMKGAATVASALTLAGGIGAAGMLAITALFSWAIASPGAVDPGAAFHTLQFLPFLFGGPGWAGFDALFLAGVALGTKGEGPRWMRGFGYVLAVVSALAMLVLITIYFSPGLPVARFIGFVWLIAISIISARAEARALTAGPR